MLLKSLSSKSLLENAVRYPETPVILTLTLNAVKEKWKNPRILFEEPKLYLRRVALLSASASLAALAGCHSAYIAATVSNRTAAPISVIQVEYPSASFGTQTIAPGADFHYRFKVLGSGSMKITWTDTAEHEQTATGPALTEGTEGALGITVAPDGVHWQVAPAAK